MKNIIEINTDGEQLISSVNDGTNTLYINGTLIDSSEWIGTGNYTATIEGHNITIAKIADTNGIVQLIRNSAYNYALLKAAVPGSGGSEISVDSALSITSINPVQNRIITQALNSKADTGDLPEIDTEVCTVSNNFVIYGNTTPIVKKYGDVIQLEGKLNPANEINGSATEINMLTIPQGFRPKREVTAICQGSGRNTWLARVKTSGNVTFSRYGADSTYTNVPTNAWLSLNVIWVISEDSAYYDDSPDTGGGSVDDSEQMKELTNSEIEDLLT